MSRNRIAVSAMSRHPGLNWGPTDYESLTAQGKGPFLASEHTGTNHSKRAKSTKTSPRKTAATERARGGALLVGAEADSIAELARLRAAYCEVGEVGAR